MDKWIVTVPGFPVETTVSCTKVYPPGADLPEEIKALTRAVKALRESLRFRRTERTWGGDGEALAYCLRVMV